MIDCLRNEVVHFNTGLPVYGPRKRRDGGTRFILEKDMEHDQISTQRITRNDIT